MNMRPLSSAMLALSGTMLMLLGFYFIFMRPALLPEDARYMGQGLSAVQSALPGLTRWLSRVFWVMGGYIFSTGLLTTHVARTSFRARARGAWIVVAIAGVTSIGMMSVVNFIIDSDFKWVILLLAVPWVAALILYRLERA